MTHERLEITARCLRDTRNDQLWEAYAEYAEYKGRRGPTVQSHSRKSVRTKARTAFEGSRLKRARRALGFFILAHTPVRRFAWWLTRP